MQSPFRLVAVLAFLALPLLEIALLIKLGQVLGFWPVIAIVLVTALAGVFVIRTQGLATMRRMSDALAHDRAPHAELADGALLLLAGMLLVLPGPMTDVTGVLLLLPPVRKMLAALLFRHAAVARGRFDDGAADDGSVRSRQPGRERVDTDRARRRDDTVIDGEFERLGERTLDPRTGGGPGRPGNAGPGPPAEPPS